MANVEFEHYSVTAKTNGRCASCRTSTGAHQTMEPRAKTRGSALGIRKFEAVFCGGRRLHGGANSVEAEHVGGMVAG